MEFGNPIAFKTIPELLFAVINVFIIIATPIVVFFLIYAGFKYVTAQGNPEQIAEASKALMYGIIGGVIIMGSVAIMLIVQNVVSQF
jgi:hypothetical protein